MADPLSVVGAVVGLMQVTAALTVKLTATFSDIKLAPAEIQELIQTQKTSVSCLLVPHQDCYLKWMRVDCLTYQSFQQSLSAVANLVQEPHILDRADIRATCEGLLASVTDRAERTVAEPNKIILPQPESSGRKSWISRRTSQLRMGVQIKDATRYKERLEEYSRTLVFVMSILSVYVVSPTSSQEHANYCLQ